MGNRSMDGWIDCFIYLYSFSLEIALDALGDSVSDMTSAYYNREMDEHGPYNRQFIALTKENTGNFISIVIYNKN